MFFLDDEERQVGGSCTERLRCLDGERVGVAPFLLLNPRPRRLLRSILGK
jgi:hypothetical protein